MKKILQTIILLFLCAVLVYIEILRVETPYIPPETETETISETPEPTETPAVEETAAPTPEPTPTPTPEPSEFVFSFIGDCTLWSNANYAGHPAGYAGTINGDYSYPFANTVQYFAEDECTFANLECLLSDTQMTVDYTAATFAFVAPTEYANIILEGKVDFVTTANNHLMDCYELGRDRTYETLESYGIPYGKEQQAQMITTENGIKVGVYTAGTNMRPDWKKDDIVAAIQQLRADGADVVVCMFHWSDELYYKPYDYQTELAHACIDAGADVVYGTHPHCLQPVEEYGSGIIMYSMGNWTFGGSTMPSDPDTAIMQVIITKSSNGSYGYGGYKLIPCCVSSKLEDAETKAQNYNDYKPTPYAEDSEAYFRTMSKLDGSFEPTSQGVDYSAWYASRAAE